MSANRDIGFTLIGAVLGMYLYALALDIHSGFHLVGFIFGTGMSIITIIVIYFLFIKRHEHKGGNKNNEQLENI